MDVYTNQTLGTHSRTHKCNVYASLRACVRLCACMRMRDGAIARPRLVCTTSKELLECTYISTARGRTCMYAVRVCVCVHVVCGIVWCSYTQGQRYYTMFNVSPGQ